MLVLNNGKMGQDELIANYTSAFIHSGEGEVILDGITLYNLVSFGEAHHSLGNRYGIYNLTAAAYDFGSDGGKTLFKKFEAEKGTQAVGVFNNAEHMWHAGEVIFEEIVGGVGHSSSDGDGGKGGNAIGMILQGLEYNLEENGKISMTVIGGKGVMEVLRVVKKGMVEMHMVF